MKKTIIFFSMLLFLNMKGFSLENNPHIGNYEVSQAGKINQCPVYRLQLNNPTAATLTIQIKDEFGVVLHEELVNDKKVIRNYMLDVVDLGNTKVSLVVYTKKGFAVSEPELYRELTME
jgi:hypothetical protein